MRAKIIHEAKAEIILTNAEIAAVKSRQVPMIYSPGGMGPTDTFEGNRGYFGGACFVDAERNLNLCLDQFRVALGAAIAKAKG
jgi:hypothetical protein